MRLSVSEEGRVADRREGVNVPGITGKVLREFRDRGLTDKWHISVATSL